MHAHVFYNLYRCTIPSKDKKNQDLGGRNVYALQLFLTEPLTLDDLVVACVVIERIAPFAEIVQDISRVQEGHPGAVIPAHSQKGIF